MFGVFLLTGATILFVFSQFVTKILLLLKRFQKIWLLRQNFPKNFVLEVWLLLARELLTGSILVANSFA